MQRIVVLNPKGGSGMTTIATNLASHFALAVANRVRRHTLSSQSLLRFLGTLGIPIVATLRASQDYLRAAEAGA